MATAKQLFGNRFCQKDWLQPLTTTLVQTIKNDFKTAKNKTTLKQYRRNYETTLFWHKSGFDYSYRWDWIFWQWLWFNNVLSWISWYMMVKYDKIYRVPKKPSFSELSTCRLDFPPFLRQAALSRGEIQSAQFRKTQFFKQPCIFSDSAMFYIYYRIAQNQKTSRVDQ